jgi:DNA-binding GntR family transcriptional regulator
MSSLLKVSRATVREALNQLAQVGLVVQVPYTGLRIAHLDAQALRDIAKTRVALDMLALTAVVEDTTGKRTRQVMAGWEELQRHRDENSPVLQHEAHLSFHRCIWEASENYLLLKLWPVTEAQITVALAEDQLARENQPRAFDVHEKLIQAILTGDLDRIHQALVEQTIDSAEELIAILGEGEE